MGQKLNVRWHCPLAREITPESVFVFPFVVAQTRIKTGKEIPYRATSGIVHVSVLTHHFSHNQPVRWVLSERRPTNLLLKESRKELFLCQFTELAIYCVYEETKPARRWVHNNLY